MENIPNSTSTWIWWVFSVILVSFIVNITSTYAKPLLDNMGVKYSNKRRKKITETKKKYDKVVENFDTPEGITHLKIDLLSLYIQISIVLIATLIIANVLYDFIDLNMMMNLIGQKLVYKFIEFTKFSII